MRTAFLVAVGAIVLALAVRNLPLISAWKADFYRTSPLYVVIRLGCVLIICSGLYFMEKRLHWMPHSIRLAGQESLLVYGAHLIIIFSFLRQPPLATVLGKEAGYGVCFLISLALILLMLLSAKIWNGWKRNYPRFAKSVLIAAVVASAIVFMFR
jgi:fucose 4-O-acetylase-like acetyltransferase